MRIIVDASDLDRLADDLREVGAESRRVFDHAARDAARDGNRVAKAFARRSAGDHGRRYPNSFYAARVGVGSFTYGPTGGKAQGGMSFEYGSRNQKPHLDLARSADIVERDLPGAVFRELSGLLTKHRL